jgi:CubicO group peptidase (beta-lactamase class C family)
MEELIHRIEQAAFEMEFSGVISIFRTDSTAFSRAFGYRNVKDKLNNTTSTRFAIASGTKLFTVPGVGVLIDHGVISLGTTMTEIDQEYTGFIDKRATILQLLIHTFGI